MLRAGWWCRWHLYNAGEGCRIWGREAGEERCISRTQRHHQHQTPPAVIQDMQNTREARETGGPKVTEEKYRIWNYIDFVVVCIRRIPPTAPAPSCSNAGHTEYMGRSSGRNTRNGRSHISKYRDCMPLADNLLGS